MQSTYLPVRAEIITTPGVSFEVESYLSLPGTLVLLDCDTKLHSWKNCVALQTLLSVGDGKHAMTNEAGFRYIFYLLLPLIMN